jgi:aminomethyltransferase
MDAATKPKRTPLYSIHAHLGAKIIDFHGWEMPVQYSGIIEEHKCVRGNAGIFDLSHMGEFTVQGTGALAFLQTLTTRDLSTCENGQAYYSCICYEHGGIIDDLIVYRKKAEDYLVVVNASNIEKDFAWFKKHCPKAVQLANISDDIALVAVQGPNSIKIIQPLVKKSVGDLYFYHHREDEVAGCKVILARTGYTGEDGFEIYSKSTDAEKIWNAVWEKGAAFGMKPIGLGARDTLRLEMAYSLYGNELNEDVNPIEAGIGWAVSTSKKFIGSDVIQPLKKSGTKRKIAGFKLAQRGIPRQHYIVKSASKPIGEVTSGTLSPMLNEGIGLALIESEQAVKGARIAVTIRDNDVPAVIVPVPFVQSKTYKKQ